MICSYQSATVRSRVVARPVIVCKLFSSHQAGEGTETFIRPQRLDVLLATHTRQSCDVIGDVMTLRHCRRLCSRSLDVVDDSDMTKSYDCRLGVL